MMAQGRRLLLLLQFLFLLLFSVTSNGIPTGLDAAAAGSTVECTRATCSSHTTATSHITLSRTEEDCVSSHTTVDLDAAEACILEFLNKTETSDKIFHVQGWRWHTLSLVRDARRLGNLASSLMRLEQKTSYSTTTAMDSTTTTTTTVVVHDDRSLEKAVHHVIEFNMNALHRIEHDLFFPWLRSQLTLLVEDPELAQAFSVLLDDLVAKQRAVSELGSKVLKQIDVLYNETSSDSERMQAISQISKLSADISSLVQNILNEQDKFIVPAIAILVPESKQRAFNNKVILNLGVMDSRLHLVGMHEAVLEQDEREQALFQQEIPAIPRYMIPRWKRLLYDPQASVLEAVESQ